MIEFDMAPGAMRVLAIWYVAAKGEDWMACVSRKRGEDAWTMRYRFRYYSGSRDPFDESDRKSWYSGTIDDEAEGEILAKMDLVAAFVAKGKGGKLTRLLINGDGRKAMELLAKEPWSHVVVVPQ